MAGTSATDAVDTQYFDVIILVPTMAEMQGVRPLFESIITAGRSARKIGPYYGGTSYEVSTGSKSPTTRIVRIALVCCDRMGNVMSAVNTAFFLGKAPNLIISAGIAGSLDPKRAWIGDVVTPTFVNTFFYRKVSDAKPALSSESPHAIEVFEKGKFRLRDDKGEAGMPDSCISFVGDIDRDALERKLGEEKPSSALAAYFAELRDLTDEPSKVPPSPRWAKEFHTFSWEKVLDSRTYAAVLALRSECVCVEMESWGFATAIGRFRTPTTPLIVRAISDIVGRKAHSDELEGADSPRGYAMRSLARALDHLIFDQWMPTIG